MIHEIVIRSSCTQSKRSLSTTSVHAKNNFGSQAPAICDVRQTLCLSYLPAPAERFAPLDLDVVAAQAGRQSNLWTLACSHVVIITSISVIDYSL